MSPLSWTDTLDAPRSLVTGDKLAIVVLEDPGVLEVRAHAEDASLPSIEAELGA
jgi:hypothetical protein